MAQLRNGPLSLLGSLIKADPEFHQMVKDFYDSGFSESSADDKPEMSQEQFVGYILSVGTLKCRWPKPG